MSSLHSPIEMTDAPRAITLFKELHILCQKDTETFEDELILIKRIFKTHRRALDDYQKAHEYENRWTIMQIWDLFRAPPSLEKCRLQLENVRSRIHHIMLCMFCEISTDFCQLSPKLFQDGLVGLPSHYRVVIENWLESKQADQKEHQDFIPYPGETFELSLYVAGRYLLARKEIQEPLDLNFLSFVEGVAKQLKIKEIQACMQAPEFNRQSIRKRADIIDSFFSINIHMWQDATDLDLRQLKLTQLTGKIFVILRTIRRLNSLCLKDNLIQTLPHKINDLSIEMIDLRGNPLDYGAYQTLHTFPPKVVILLDESQQKAFEKVGANIPVVKLPEIKDNDKYF